MCSIFGAVSLTGDNVKVNLSQLVMDSSSRGRDSHGYAFARGPYSTSEVTKGLGVPKLDSDSLKMELFYFVGNCRAEPTTEFLQYKLACDTQPYTYGNMCVVHNGVIANDKELAAEFDIPRVHNVDSEVLPKLLYQCETEQEVQELLRDTVKGSFALAAYHPQMRKMILATNFKPLYIRKEKDVLYFASLAEHLNFLDMDHHWSDETAVRVPHYTVSFIDPFKGGRDSVKTLSLYPESGKKVLVIASSGLDSTVAAQWAIRKNFDVELLHFSYGCHATGNEMTAIKRISERFDVPLHTVSTDFFKQAGGSNLLTEDDSTVSTGEAGAELAHEWVPARNLVFLSLATAFAEARGFDYILLGGNLEESGAYADNEYSFQKDFETMLPGALNLGHQVKLLIPLGNLMKREIVELGVELGAPLELTWSCYKNGRLHCGNCGPCFMRRTAFKMANIPEVIEYES